MSLNVIDGDLKVTGQAVFQGAVSLPSSGISDAHIAANAGISVTKLKLQECLRYTQAPGTAVVAATQLLGGVHGTSGSVVLARALVNTVATGADRTVTLDIKNSHSGGAFASILTSTLAFNNASTALTWSNFTISTASIADNDVLEVTCAVAGSAGNQAQGLLVEVYVVHVADG